MLFRSFPEGILSLFGKAGSELLSLISSVSVSWVVTWFLWHDFICLLILSS